MALRIGWREVFKVEPARGEGNESAATVRTCGSAAIEGRIVSGLDWRGVGLRAWSGFGCAGSSAERQGRGVFDKRGCGERTEEMLGSEQAGVDVCRSEQSVMADLEELIRQDVEEEAAQELLRRERAGLFAAGAKDDFVVGDREQA